MDTKPLNRIKVVMAERMVSNKDLSEMLGKDTATISRWVTNKSQPTLESLIEISEKSRLTFQFNFDYANQ